MKVLFIAPTTRSTGLIMRRVMTTLIAPPCWQQARALAVQLLPQFDDATPQLQCIGTAHQILNIWLDVRGGPWLKPDPPVRQPRWSTCSGFSLDTTPRSSIYVECLGMTTNTERTEFLKGTLDMLILKIVALGPSHGYAISQRIQQISRDFFQIPQGSLYPALHRLEERGWLEAEWRDTETGREAKFYKLTKKGWKQLDAEILGWKQTAEAVSLILRTVE